MKLYVGGLSWNTNENLLRESFEGYGEVEDVRIITDRDSGRSRGFGFVSFVNREDAVSAMEALNGTELDGRSITVNEARAREPRGGGGGGGGGGRNRW